jgi:hypothetical protein
MFLFYSKCALVIKRVGGIFGTSDFSPKVNESAHSTIKTSDIR